VAFLFDEDGEDENSLVRQPDAHQRTGGPEPHAAKDGWIAIR
jgi:hypothetical protein